MLSNLMLFYREYAPAVYFMLRRKSINRRLRQIKFLLMTPVLSIISVFNCVREKMAKNLNLIYKRTEKESYEFELVFVGIVKNEGAYIEEWLTYHEMAGVERFVIYDNESTDDLKNILRPYIERGLVEYIYFPGRAKQLDAYYDGLQRYKNRARLMGFIDLDEFVISAVEGGKIEPAVLDLLEADESAAGVAINWYVYGSSGHKLKPEGIVTENYLYRSYRDDPVNEYIKTIGNPRLMKGYIFNPHTPIYRTGYHSINGRGVQVDVDKKGRATERSSDAKDAKLDEGCEKLRINHYFCKSEEEGKRKFARGLATHEQDVKYEWDEYRKYDRNEVYDDVALKYAEAIKSLIQQNRKGHCE